MREFNRKIKISINNDSEEGGNQNDQTQANQTNQNEANQTIDDGFFDVPVEDDEVMEMDNDAKIDGDDTGSVYYDSDDLGSYYSETDEDEAQRKQTSKILFDSDALIPFFSWNGFYKCKTG